MKNQFKLIWQLNPWNKYILPLIIIFIITNSISMITISEKASFGSPFNLMLYLLLLLNMMLFRSSLDKNKTSLTYYIFPERYHQMFKTEWYYMLLLHILFLVFKCYELFAQHIPQVCISVLYIITYSIFMNTVFITLIYIKTTKFMRVFQFCHGLGLYIVALFIYQSIENMIVYEKLSFESFYVSSLPVIIFFVVMLICYFVIHLTTKKLVKRA